MSRRAYDGVERRLRACCRRAYNRVKHMNLLTKLDQLKSC